MSERGVPDEVPAHWLVYFAVEDTDATVEQTKAGAAASVMVGPIDIPVGPLRRPHRPARGAAFAVIALETPSSAATD